MRDIFFTILVIWVLWKIFSGTRLFYSSHKNQSGQGSGGAKKEGETTVTFNGKKENSKDPGGEYVDYEEVKK